jgi:hypothetical protein
MSPHWLFQLSHGSRWVRMARRGQSGDARQHYEKAAESPNPRCAKQRLPRFIEERSVHRTV